MPNIKSAKKRVKVSQKKHDNNQMQKNALRTIIKSFVCGADNRTEEGYRNVIKNIDEAVKKGIFHKNTAARRKSMITKLYNGSKN